LWEELGYPTVPDTNCQWSDGLIGGPCCEVFAGSLEIGNLVNPLGHSTDVGFGWERLIQLVEEVDRVDGSSLFRQDLHPIGRDHSRTVDLLHEHRIEPGNRGRRYVCRRLIQRRIPRLGGHEEFPFREWLRREIILREEKLKLGRRMIGSRRFRDKPLGF
jgi:hypothetical protein